MVSNFGELVLAFYFSSLLLVFIPALGLAVGAITGKLTPGVGAPLGSLVGLACGVLGLVLSLCCILGNGGTDRRVSAQTLIPFDSVWPAHWWRLCSCSRVATGSELAQLAVR